MTAMAETTTFTELGVEGGEAMAKRWVGSQNISSKGQERRVGERPGSAVLQVVSGEEARSDKLLLGKGAAVSF